MLPSHPRTALEQRDADREWLKSLKRRYAEAWRFSVHHPSLDGLVRLETRREVLWLEDGLCVHAGPTSPNASHALLGMTLVAWATETGELRDSFAPGCRAIFWTSTDNAATIGLTSRVSAFKAALPLTGVTRPLLVTRGAFRPLMDEEAATLPFFRAAPEPLPATMRSPNRAA